MNRIKNIKAMKTLTFLSAAIVLLSACSATQQTSGTYNDDDVYASTKDKPVQQAPVNTVPQTTSAPQAVSPAPSPAQSPSSTAVEQDGKGNTYITNKYYESDFDYDDYYDYEYAVRMRRFYHPVSTYNYYDNYYTNSYWYSAQPAHWGLSVYLGYPWWGASYYSYNYYPQSYYHSGWGGGWGGYGWNGWGGGWCGNGYGYNPYYGGGYGHGYNHGYNHGYQDGYWDGYWNKGSNAMDNNYYYNSHDNSGHYYGPNRNSTHENGKAITPHGEKFEDAKLKGFTPVNMNSAVKVNPNIGSHPKGALSNAGATSVLVPSNNTGVVKNNNNAPPLNQGSTVPAANINPALNAQPNSNMNNLPEVKAEKSKNNMNEGNPGVSNPNISGTPKNYEMPKTHEKPVNYDAPKNYEKPKNYDTPKNNNTYNPPKRNYDAPKQNNNTPNYNTPRSNPAPKSSGGGNNNAGGSRPASGGFKYR